MGSGTTLVACELINRGMWDEFKLNVNETAKRVKWNIKSIGIEIVPEFIEIAKKRLSVFSETLDI
jgi:DNA modification methylase